MGSGEVNPNKRSHQYPYCYSAQQFTHSFLNKMYWWAGIRCSDKYVQNNKSLLVTLLVWQHLRHEPMLGAKLHTIWEEFHHLTTSPSGAPGGRGRGDTLVLCFKWHTSLLVPSSLTRLVVEANYKESRKCGARSKCFWDVAINTDQVQDLELNTEDNIKEYVLLPPQGVPSQMDDPLCLTKGVWPVPDR